ncbi:hypothetical protein DP115_13870 [Brasilonema octagenarum UFV-OR1]|uniref:Uncharacterized protein n=1 Tax=Brasilonema octagenarum UFV-OR1 TaxID=417115 RepID=A0ABX1MCZ3_9CYAN|nr:hypothetical protein [Brasilonema octagenarum UFV-OR1]
MGFAQFFYRRHKKARYTSFAGTAQGNSYSTIGMIAQLKEMLMLLTTAFFYGSIAKTDNDRMTWSK